jgi:putative chitinase
MITENVLRAVGASAPAASLYAPLLEAARFVPYDRFYTITSRNGIAMLVSQLAHESAHFSTMTENLNYQVAALTSLFGSKRITKTEAEAVGRTNTQKADQRAIANIVYGGEWGRKNLGNTEPNDGWVFRGGGPLQLTGRDNYTRWGKTINLTPEQAALYVRTPEGGIAAALWFWRTNGLLTPAFNGDVSTCTKIINGGSNGLNARIELFKQARNALT